MHVVVIVIVDVVVMMRLRPPRLAVRPAQLLRGPLDKLLGAEMLLRRDFVRGNRDGPVVLDLDTELVGRHQKPLFSTTYSFCFFGSAFSCHRNFLAAASSTTLEMLRLTAFSNSAVRARETDVICSLPSRYVTV